MSVARTTPLLSICISTYNAAHLLRVTLGAVLPQVAKLDGLVEVLVVDDVSKDGTAAVVTEASELGPVRYVRNEKNLGSSANLVNGPVNHARGEYVWCWNQHCLIRPGALARVVHCLEANSHLEVIYANFRCASYPTHWPESAEGGYDGAFEYLSKCDLLDSAVNSWSNLLDTATCMATPSYAHLVKRSVWISYWKQHEIGESYIDAISTYPHTTMLAETVLFRPTFYLGDPVITIYNGAQSWGDLRSRAKVWMRGWTDLIVIYRAMGLPIALVKDAELRGSQTIQEIMRDAFIAQRKDVISMLAVYLRRYWLQKGAIRAVWNAYLESSCDPLSRAIVSLLRVWGRFHLYCFHQCRPARWWKARNHQITF